MNKKIKFRKGKIVIGIIFFLIMFAFIIIIALNPEIFISRNLSNAERIIMGILSTYFVVVVYSFIRIIPRKFAIAISEEYLIDNSKFEALGEIKWSEISKIRRKEKKSIEVFFKEPVFKRKGLDILKKILLFMHNWNPNKSIIISSALLECSIEELYEIVSDAYKRSKHAPQDTRK